MHAKRTSPEVPEVEGVHVASNDVDRPEAPTHTPGRIHARASAITGAERPGSAFLWGAVAAIVGFALLAALRRAGQERVPRDGAARTGGPTREARGDMRGATHVESRMQAARQLNTGAATIAFSVLTDSTFEHYRGGFYNPAMYIAPAVSGFTLAAAASGVWRPRSGGQGPTAVYCAAALAGVVGFGFHVVNVSRREGGWNWLNAFYGAPVAAPLAIHMAGLLGLAALSVAADGAAGGGGSNGSTDDGGEGGRVGGAGRLSLLGLPAGAAVAGLAALGLLGTAAEAGLFHFRGAFQNPYMYLPVTVPPTTALALAVASFAGTPRRRRLARALLRTTIGLGFAGVGFHAYGVHRNMGGWLNWTQNVQNGPPIPAPPSFTGLALAGLAALNLLESEEAADARGSAGEAHS